jgi:myosin heavy subunit
MGFASRFLYEEFFDRYRVITKTTGKSKKDGCEQIVSKLDALFPTAKGLWQKGLTKVFLKTEMVWIISL